MRATTTRPSRWTLRSKHTPGLTTYRLSPIVQKVSVVLGFRDVIDGVYDDETRNGPHAMVMTVVTNKRSPGRPTGQSSGSWSRMRGEIMPLLEVSVECLEHNLNGNSGELVLSMVNLSEPPCMVDMCRGLLFGSFLWGRWRGLFQQCNDSDLEEEDNTISKIQRKWRHVLSKEKKAWVQSRYSDLRGTSQLH